MRIRFSAPAATLLLFLTGTNAARATLQEEGCNLALSVHFSIEQKIQKCEMVVHAALNGAPPEQRAFGYYTRGLLYQMLGKDDLAIADYTAAMGWKRFFEDAYAARADAYEDLGQSDKAQADYTEAAALKTDGPGALAGRCWARAVRGHPLDRALADCDAAFAAGADETETHLLRCFVNFRLAHYADAAADCGKAETERPRYAAALYVGGVAKLRSGNTQGGNADIAAALQADSTIADIWALYGVRR